MRGLRSNGGDRTSGGRFDRATVGVVVVVAALGALVVGVPFFAATTFVGDDHLFLAFARYAPNPLVAFVRDQHGGEFYRPLPMVVWWILGRLAPGTPAVFAALALALHVVVAIEVGALVMAAGGERRTAGIAALLFFVSPFTREAAYWFSASTDLFAAAFGLASVIAAVRGRRVVAALLLAAACWSKETATVVPALAAVAFIAREPRAPRRAVALRIVALWPVVGAYLVARTLVLRSVGGSGDQVAPPVGKAVQIASGLVHAMTSSQTLGEGPAWTVGVAAWVLLLVALGCRAWRGRRDPNTPLQAPVSMPPSAASVAPSPRVFAALAAVAPLAFIAVTLVPLFAARWIVGARYFYLPAAGIAWLAAQALRSRPLPVVAGVVCGLAGLGLGQDLARRGEIQLYEAKLGAARRAVVSGVGEGFTTFHIAAGIKDLDLAVKEDPRTRAAEASLLVLGDVPASFIAFPVPRRSDLELVLAHPPLPPSGAYRFGDYLVAGSPRRGEDPSLDEVTARFPGIRFIRLRAGPGGRVIARDVTGLPGPGGADDDADARD